MIHVVIGTKAQLVKMCPVLREMEAQGVPYNFIFTGQHQKTVDDIRDNFSIKGPDVVLYKGKDVDSIASMLVWGLKIIGRTISGKEAVFKKDRKGIVLVHGDTFSCLLGAVLGKLKGLKVGHVESGLRSFNLFHPFPEELTRILTFYLADVYFCPGQWAIDNLGRFNGEKINTYQNTLLDALHLAIANVDEIEVDVPEEKYCVVTVHRFENIFRRAIFAQILDQVEEIAKHKRVLFILHPPTEKRLKEFCLFDRLDRNKNIELRPRYDYYKFIKLVYKSEFLVTDGGSNQEESYYMGKPCLLIRKATERNEGLGKNVVLSEYNGDIIADFVANYEKYVRKNEAFNCSPSKIVTTVISKYA